MGSQEKLLAIHDPKAIFPPLVLGKDNDPITKSMTAVWEQEVLLEATSHFPTCPSLWVDTQPGPLWFEGRPVCVGPSAWAQSMLFFSVHFFVIKRFIDLKEKYTERSEAMPAAW